MKYNITNHDNDVIYIVYRDSPLCSYMVGYFKTDSQAKAFCDAKNKEHKGFNVRFEYWALNQIPEFELS